MRIGPSFANIGSVTDSPSIAIIGAGAVGGYYGGRLAQHGRDVHFLLRGDYDAWRRDGLRVRSIDGDFALTPSQLHVYNSPAAMPKVDLVIVALKTTENRHLGQLIAPLLRDDTAILTLQNGLGNEELLADLFGAARVFGCMAFTCINRIEAGVLHHSEYGHLRIGEFVSRPAAQSEAPGRAVAGFSAQIKSDNAAASERASAIVRMFNDSQVRAEAIDDLRLGRWDKQVWNVPFNGLGALLDATTDQLIATDEGTALVRTIMEEVVQAAAADGVKLPPHTPEQKIAVTRPMGPYLTSTQIDRRLGKAMEIDAIFGKPVEIARSAGVRLPLLEMLNFSLRHIDACRSDNLGKRNR